MLVRQICHIVHAWRLRLLVVPRHSSWQQSLAARVNTASTCKSDVPMCLSSAVVKALLAFQSELHKLACRVLEQRPLLRLLDCAAAIKFEQSFDVEARGGLGGLHGGALKWPAIICEARSNAGPDTSHERLANADAVAPGVDGSPIAAISLTNVFVDLHAAEAMPHLWAWSRRWSACQCSARPPAACR